MSPKTKITMNRKKEKNVTHENATHVKQFNNVTHVK